MKKFILALAALVALTLSTGMAMAQGMYVLESTNFPGMFIRHYNFQAVLTKVENLQDKKDAVFLGQPGLTGYNISFESFNFRGYFLRHKNFQLVLEKNDGSDLFKQDATFNGKKQANGGYMWESVNFPGYFLRHKNFKLVLEKNDGSGQFYADATFQMKSSGPVEDPAPPPPPQDNTPAPTPPKGTQGTAATDTTIYDKPEGEDQAYLSEGDPVTIINCNGDNWCHISEPQDGWVWGDDLNH